jgi:hypothetical protein
MTQIAKLKPVYALGAGISGRVTAAKVDEIIEVLNGLTDGISEFDIVKLANGTAAVPSLTYVTDSDTGIYRIGANNLGITLGGTKYVDFAANLTGFTGAITTTTTVTVGTVLRNGDGTVLLPSITFTSDLNTGIYRIGADNIGVTCSGAKVLDIATTGLSVTGLMSASTTVTAGTLVLTGAGAVDAPSLSFTLDPDTGFYNIGANRIGVATNGVQVAEFNQTTGILTDGVGELTAAAGVGIDGVLVKDGSLSNTILGVTKYASFYPTETQQNLSGAGTINLTSYHTAWTTTGPDAGTLANAAFIGHKKKITMVADGGDGTLTPTSLSGGTTITFDDAGDYVVLLWNGTAWVAIEYSGVVIA